VNAVVKLYGIIAAVDINPLLLKWNFTGQFAYKKIHLVPLHLHLDGAMDIVLFTGLFSAAPTQ